MARDRQPTLFGGTEAGPRSPKERNEDLCARLMDRAGDFATAGELHDPDPRGGPHLVPYVRAAIGYAVAVVITEWFGLRRPVSPRRKGDKRESGTAFEKEVVGPGIEARPDAFLSRLNQLLGSLFDGLDLEAVGVDVSEGRAALDLRVDLCGGGEEFAWEANLKYGAGKSKDNTAGDRSVLGYGALLDNQKGLVEVCRALEAGEVPGDGYMVLHFTPSQSALIDSVAVVDCLAMAPEEGRCAINAINGLQMHFHSESDRFHEAALRGTPCDFLTSLERYVAWHATSLVWQHYTKLHKATSAFPADHPVHDLVSQRVARGLGLPTLAEMLEVDRAHRVATGGTPTSFELDDGTVWELDDLALSLPCM